ncbi:hypothetical protein OG738_34635 [Amycolatopsis sp. NBC_01488]|uniref:hypothetical protein n=1 Tax=Amycolatopsis sp. NBC_01488 TaxID=2903563 RepID=UPI002E27B943|nr:hypothetical protein [Amycolatopsis sp. NBC_01488]
MLATRLSDAWLRHDSTTATPDAPSADDLFLKSIAVGAADNPDTITIWCDFTLVCTVTGPSPTIGCPSTYKCA